jgi:hypothetical protein
LVVLENGPGGLLLEPRGVQLEAEPRSDRRGREREREPPGDVHDRRISPLCGRLGAMLASSQSRRPPHSQELLAPRILPGPHGPRPRGELSVEVERSPVRLRGAPIAVAFAGAALIAGFTLLRGIDPFDEGLVLQAARRVSEGELPYRDFLWSYGPAQPYVLGASFQLFGVSLLGWRIIRLLAVAGIATLVLGLARREAGARLGWVVWLAAACALAQPASANPFAVALLLALGGFALVVPERVGTGRALTAGLLVGVAAAWRLDFALYGGAAALLRLACGDQPARRRLWLCAVLAGAVAAVTIVAYLPFAIAVGPADLYDALLGKSFREKDYWTLPFPLSYDGGLRTWPPRDALEDLKDVLGFYVPLLLVIAAAVAVVTAAVRLRVERRPPAVWLALLVLGAGVGAYLLSRTDEFHTAPLLTVVAVLLAGAAVWLRRRVDRPARALALLAVALLGLLTLHGVANRLSALFLPPDLVPLELPAADGVRAPRGEADALARVVAVVRRRVPLGEPIYVAPRRSDLVRFNNPLVYVLTERDNPLREDFGLQAGARAQASIVARLERVHPRVVVRWTDPLSSRAEPNLGGRSSGSRLLDEHLRANYRLLERAGHYDLLVPRGAE